VLRIVIERVNVVQQSKVTIIISMLAIRGVWQDYVARQVF
jgi:hypothetical protein